MAPIRLPRRLERQRFGLVKLASTASRSHPGAVRDARRCGRLLLLRSSTPRAVTLGRQQTPESLAQALIAQP
jgi:hypothetical protein